MIKYRRTGITERLTKIYMEVTGMEFFELIEKRYSCRKFEDKRVEEEKIKKILDAADLAPTACDKQPQRILVLTESEQLAKVDECTKFGFGAPLNFMVCYDKECSWHRRKDDLDHGFIDAAIVQTHMMLAATELGLGTTWVCAFDEAKAREVFNVPDNYVIAGFMPTGYPAEEPSEMHFKRAGADSFTFRNKF